MAILLLDVVVAGIFGLTASDLMRGIGSSSLTQDWRFIGRCRVEQSGARQRLLWIAVIRPADVGSAKSGDGG